MQYLRRANGAERFVLSLHELRQHERLFLEGTAPNPICCRLSRKGSLLGRALSGAGKGSRYPRPATLPAYHPVVGFRYRSPCRSRWSRGTRLCRRKRGFGSGMSPPSKEEPFLCAGLGNTARSVHTGDRMQRALATVRQNSFCLLSLESIPGRMRGADSDRQAKLAGFQRARN